jgi:hypothetical protein
MVDLRVQTGLDWLLFIMKISYTFFNKQAILMMSTVLNLSPQLGFLGETVIYLSGYWNKVV